MRVRNVCVRAAAGADIPNADAMEQEAGQPTLGATLKPRLLEVLMLQVPCVAHRRVDVGDVELIWPGQHSLRHGIAAGDHQVIA